MSNEEIFHTIIIGGGQAGLAAGYYLAQHGRNFVILDDRARTGDIWRSRWDSLRLFTPSQFDGLPGLPFPAPHQYFPTKDETADYLESYAAHFNLPVRHQVKVDSLSRSGGKYRVSAGEQVMLASNVIVATGAYHTPYTPPFASELDPSIQQMHSVEYRNPKQVAGRRVLVVGAGNSGVEIALDLDRGSKHAIVAGRNVGSLPAETFGSIFGGRPYWWVISHVLSLSTPFGRRMKSKILFHGSPLIRTSRFDLARIGQEFKPRLARVKFGKPLLEDGHLLDVDCVVWSTGFRPNFSWIRLPILAADGYPRHKRGVVPEAPGLYFVGLHFQNALSSALLGGVGADAEYVTHYLERAMPGEPALAYA
jgi:putative flavoprotein involved in K+ transport